MAALLSVAYSGGDDSSGNGSAGGNGSGGTTASACPPVVNGSTYGMLGTATVHGAGMLPAGLPDGYRFELVLDEGGFTSGVAPATFNGSPDTCGRSFTYKIVALEPGTYKLGYELYAHDSNPDPAYRGTSTNEFTVTDNANVEFNPTF